MTPQSERDLDQRCIDTLRTLAIDQVQKANSGHPGTPMGAAPRPASALGWDRHLGHHGEIIAMRSFGLSAPGKEAKAHFGFDVAHVLAAARRQMKRHGAGDSA